MVPSACSVRTIIPKALTIYVLVVDFTLHLQHDRHRTLWIGSFESILRFLFYDFQTKR
jgi:hypothetical protein